MAYEATEWTDLFVAVAGAAAALTGLVFVAVSINVQRILEFRGLPERALATVMVLLLPVIVSMFALAPGQSTLAIGAEVALLGAGMLVLIHRLLIASDAHDAVQERRAAQVLSLAPGPVLVFLSGLSIAAEAGGGFYVLLAGIALSILMGVVNAWVLLVEILR